MAPAGGCVAIGNILASDCVPAAMAEASAAAPEEPFAAPLLRGLEAALTAGGEHGPVLSASLSVVDCEVFPLVDLRIDRAEQPIAQLRALWEADAPFADHFVRRAVAPETV